MSRPKILIRMSEQGIVAIATEEVDLYVEDADQPEDWEGSSVTAIQPVLVDEQTFAQHLNEQE